MPTSIVSQTARTAAAAQNARNAASRWRAFATSTMKGSKVQWASAPWPRSEASVPEFTLGVQDVMMAFNRPNNTETVRKFLEFVYSDPEYLKFVKGEGFLPTTTSAGQAMASDQVAGPGIAL